MPHRLLMVLAILIAIPGTGQNAFAQEAESDWGFSASVGWSWREIDGTLFTIKPPLTGLATTDSLGLGSSSEAEASIGMRWKRLGVRLDYLPSEFSGDGTLALALDFGNGPIIGGTTPVSTDINVTMTLANIEYDLLARADMDWSIGVGFGSIDLDFTLMPETGPTVAIGNDLPFGYLTMTFTKRWQKFSASVNVQG